MIRKLKYWLIYTFLCPVAVWGLRLYKRLVGFHNADWELLERSSQDGPVIFVMFHSRLLYAAMDIMEGYARGLQVSIELSPSRDGEIMARILEPIGVRVIRSSGASQRIGGMRAMLRELEQGHWVGFALDGPRGPRGRISNTVIKMAQRTGRPLIGFHARSPRKWRLRSWDHQELPMPFTRAQAGYIGPIYIPKDASPETLEQIKQDLKDRLYEASGE